MLKRQSFCRPALKVQVRWWQTRPISSRLSNNSWRPLASIGFRSERALEVEPELPKTLTGKVR